MRALRYFYRSKVGQYSVIVSTATEKLCPLGALGAGNCVMGITGKGELHILDYIPTDLFSLYDKTGFAHAKQFQLAAPSHMGPTRNQQTEMCHDIEQMRNDIQQKLRRRAEIEDAVLIAREKQLGQAAAAAAVKFAVAAARAAVMAAMAAGDDDGEWSVENAAEWSDDADYDEAVECGTSLITPEHTLANNRWSAACSSKGLPLTCPLCRSAVVD